MRHRFLCIIFNVILDILSSFRRLLVLSSRFVKFWWESSMFTLQGWEISGGRSLLEGAHMHDVVGFV